jgi:hypothetical protein
MVAHTYNPSTQEANAGGASVQVHPELHSETDPSSNKNKKMKLYSHSIGNFVPSQIYRVHVGANKVSLVFLFQIR